MLQRKRFCALVYHSFPMLARKMHTRSDLPKPDKSLYESQISIFVNQAAIPYSCVFFSASAFCASRSLFEKTHPQ